jgi:hypothetical protein
MKYPHLALVLVTISCATVLSTPAHADEPPCPKEGGCAEPAVPAGARDEQPADRPVAEPKAPLSKSGHAQLPVCDLSETGEAVWKEPVWKGPVSKIDGDDAQSATSVFVLGFSPSGRLGWLEQRTSAHDGAVEWSVHVTALANGRSVATQTFRAAKGGVASLCARHARDVAMLLRANGVATTGTVALKQPAVDSDPTAVELRVAQFDAGSGGGAFDLVLRGSAGSKVIGILPHAEGAAPPAVLGFIRSPYERRVAVPVTEVAAGPRGRSETRVQFYGGRLDRGWTPDESQP